MKFKVGDRVKWLGVTPYGKEPYFGTVIKIDSQTLNMKIVWDNGDLAQYNSNSVVIEPIQHEVQEPVPGKFYRTRDGNKMFYIGQDNYRYFVYQDKNGDFYQYSTATEHVSGCVNMEDIVGEWVDEVVLPAVEIKRWAVVQLVDKRIGDIKRGAILECSSNKEDLKRNLLDDEEIVELTGTLPERKV